MRLTFILSSLRLSGGVRVVIEYANRLSARGHRITFVVPGGTIDPAIQAGISTGIHIFETPRLIRNTKNPIGMAIIAWSMAQLVTPSDFIIATHTPTTAVSFITKKLMKKGKSLWLYMDYLEMFEHRPIERWLLRNALRWHDQALAISEAGVQELRSFCPGKVTNIGLGLDLQVYHPIPDARKTEFYDPGQKVIFFLGDTRPRKGMSDFLAAMEEAYKKVTNLMMWIASKENAEINTRLPYRIFVQPTDAELARLYSMCDIFISASWFEGFGLPPLEAMACGAPVITTDSRGIREFAVDGENCLVVPIKNPNRMAEAILALISNPSLADQFRKNGPLTAKRFGWELATDRFEAALLNSLNT
jgi:glycosyltransferase involved in cell wall biosynthesis